MKSLMTIARNAIERQRKAWRSARIVACASCFRNSGLRLAAKKLGKHDPKRCVRCGSEGQPKLSRGQLELLAHRFFVWGSLLRQQYGAAPLVQFNTYHKSDIDVDPLLQDDLHVFERELGVGFFYYGPRLWMVGEVEPLKALQISAARGPILKRIIDEYPRVALSPDDEFFRIRSSPRKPTLAAEYDSPPHHLAGTGRLDDTNRPVLYGAPDLEVCLHECRVTAEDDIFAATLQPTRELKLLDLSALLEEDVTEFESLDMAVHMLFLAGKHAYDHTRAIAAAAEMAGFDGLVYPSYFSLLRVGAMPLETAYGLSVRRFPEASARERWKTIPNIALFGRPVDAGKVRVSCINRLVLRRVSYDIEYGPAFDMDLIHEKGKEAAKKLREIIDGRLNATVSEFEEDWLNEIAGQKPKG